jgi:protein-L-isoaspartate(D-aspartate) O-methyltransferase
MNAAQQRDSMADLSNARRMMVDGQVKTVDVTDHALLTALGEIPRERFVPGRLQKLAYLDRDLPVAEPTPGHEGRYLMEAGPFARLVQAAEIEPGDVVLDIGCGTGYSAAVLARLASSVVALESDPKLRQFANETLSALGIDNVAVVNGALDAGYPDEGPYDVILLEGAVELIPEALFGQLKEDGRLVGVVGYGRTGQATVYQRSGSGISARTAFDAHVAPLPGFRKPKAFVF